MQACGRYNLAMPRRLLYALGGGAIGAIAGFFLACVIIVVGAGVFWLFIFGDDIWPASAENALVAFGGLIWLLGAVGGGIAGWKRAVETEARLS